MKKLLLSGIVTLAVFIGILTGIKWSKPDVAYGSIDSYQGYYATTTPSSASITTLKSLPGMLGSVVVTKTDTGTITLYDATTSNVNLRTGKTATSSLTQVFIPTSTSAGTYTYDATFANGILMVTTASAASSTVTWR